MSEQQNQISFDLTELAGGSLAEKFNIAMNKCIENMLDINTPFKNKRSVTIKVAMTQNETRDDVTVEVSVDTKLAPVAPSKTNMAIGKDLRTGQIMAEEYGSQIKGQLSLNDVMTMPDDCDPETGEVIQPSENVVNINRKVIGG